MGSIRGKQSVAKLPEQSQRSYSERIATGRQLRQLCSRRSLAEWKPSWRRRDPVELLIESSKGRLANLVPLRYGRMMANPFAFYRGAAAIMAHDLSFTPVTGLFLQVCGDCHLLNFGGFGTPERRIIFDINDSMKRPSGRGNGISNASRRASLLLAALTALTRWIAARQHGCVQGVIVRLFHRLLPTTC